MKVINKLISAISLAEKQLNATEKAFSFQLANVM